MNNIQILPLPACCAASFYHSFWGLPSDKYTYKEEDLLEFFNKADKYERMNFIRMAIVILHEIQYKAYSHIFDKQGYIVLNKVMGNGGNPIYLLVKNTGKKL